MENNFVIDSEKVIRGKIVRVGHMEDPDGKPVEIEVVKKQNPIWSKMKKGLPMIGAAIGGAVATVLIVGLTGARHCDGSRVEPDHVDYEMYDNPDV